LSDHHNAPLHPARSLGNALQNRMLVGLVAAIVGVAAVGVGVRSMLAPAPQHDEVLPPNTMRPTPEQLAALKIMPAISGANVELLRASGSISVNADHSTPILLPFSGQVARVMAQVGQSVRAGQPLLQVASPELVDARNAYLNAAAQAASAHSMAELADKNAHRQKALYDSAGGAMKDLLQAQNDAVAAQNALRSAQAALAAAKAKLALFGEGEGALARDAAGRVLVTYKAPVPGVITDRAVAPGQFVSAGGNQSLMTISDLSQVWLVAGLAESEAALVKLGDTVTVTTPALPGQQFSARIDNIGAGLDPATHRLPVRATISNAGGLLKPQMFASFVIRRSLEGKAGVLVPAAAIIHEGDSARVWVLGADGLLRARPVTLAETEGGLTRVTAGVAAGEKLVVSGALFVNEAGLDK
jgi:cobalt-zinc-cadmium efflux system membrane fusion protein